MHRSRHISWLLSVLAVLMVVAVGLPRHLLAQISYAVERGKIQASQEELARANEVSQVFRLVAKVARGGVVHIEARSDITFGDLRELREQRDEIDERLNRIRSGEEQATDDEVADLHIERRELDLRAEQLAERLSAGTGSGVIYDADGHILTNNHVVENRDDIIVHLGNEAEYHARVVGVDPESDLALLKINAGGLQPLVFGDSDAVEVGDWVLAVGAPFGLTQSVTHGIVSARGRTGIDTGTRQIIYQDFIQTDAAINPGNSGGPLLNLRGEVIGINTAIATNGDSYNAGIAFTIPSSMARKIAERLKSSGEVARGWLGVQMDELEREDRRVFEADRGGVLVGGIVPDTPAARAGMQVEDVVTAINGIPIRSSEQMLAVIGDLFPGERATFDLMRGGRSREVEVTLARRPPRNRFPRAMDRAIELLGTRVVTLLPSQSDLLPFAQTDRGALVLRPTGDLNEGDLITVCNGRMVNTAASLLAQIEQAEGDRITLEVKSVEGETRKVRIDR